MVVSLCYSVQSQRGVRSNNEDAAFVGPRLLALADGMGGHAAGDVASSLVMAEVAPLDQQQVGDPVAALGEAVTRGNDAIARHLVEHPEHEGMGTTLTALLFNGDQYGLAHVGDSRAYVLRDGSLTQITKDDTFVQSLIDDGRLTPEEAWGHPHRSMVVKAMTGQEVDPSLELREAQPGDRYLICSDGLSDYVPAEAIHRALRAPAPSQCTPALIRKALQHEGQDNITCIVADVTEGHSGYNISLLTGAPGKAATLVRG